MLYQIPLASSQLTRQVKVHDLIALSEEIEDKLTVCADVCFIAEIKVLIIKAIGDFFKTTLESLIFKA